MHPPLPEPCRMGDEVDGVCRPSRIAVGPGLVGASVVGLDERDFHRSDTRRSREPHTAARETPRLTPTIGREMMATMLTKIRLRYSQGLRSARRSLAKQKYAQYDTSHEIRKNHVTLANKNGMGFNGL